MRRWFSCGIFALALVGCGQVEEEIEDQEPPGLSAECQLAGQPCVLPDDSTGVCTEMAEQDCEEPPCLTCAAEEP